MSDDVNRILSQIAIESFIGRYITLKRNGKNFWGICPFHSEKTPSLSVSPEKGIFKCFGCGVGGNVITFVQRYEGVGFPEALKLLADHLGISLSYTKKSINRKEKDRKEYLFSLNQWVCEQYVANLEMASKAMQYLKERSIHLNSIRHFKLGYAPETFRFLESIVQNTYKNKPDEQKKTLQSLKEIGLIDQSSFQENTYNRFKGRLIFPIHDHNGKIIAFGGRKLEKDSKAAKYINSPDSLIFDKGKNLYHLYQSKESIRHNRQAILVEGYFDVIGLYQRDIQNVVAPLGTAFTKEQSKLLKRYTDKVLIFFDTDHSGVEAAFKAIQIARSEGMEVKVVNYSKKGKDPFDISNELDEIELVSLLDNSQDEMSFSLWYFLKNKYDISEISQKKKCILDFFQYIFETLEQSWEQIEYLSAASKILRIPQKSLLYDFKKFSQSGANQKSIDPNRFPAPSIKVSSRKESKATGIKATRMEKDILALLLYFPSYWGEKSLLDKIEWGSMDSHLLFNFFKDRLKAGETWQWEELKQVISILPQNLGDLLSEIILEFDEIIKNQSFKEEDYYLKLQKNIKVMERAQNSKKLLEIQKTFNRDNILSDISEEELHKKEDENNLREYQYLLDKIYKGDSPKEAKN